MPDLALTDLRRDAIRIRGPVTYKRMPEAASQSFKKGDLLAVNSGSAVLLAIAAGSDLDTDGNTLYGMAAEDASGTTSNYVNVIAFEQDTEIALPVYDSTVADAITRLIHVGDAYVLVNETTGGWCVNVGTATKAILKVVELCESYDGINMDVGDKYGPLWCRVSISALSMTNVGTSAQGEAWA